MPEPATWVYWNAGADKRSEPLGEPSLSFEAKGANLGNGPNGSEIIEGLCRLPNDIFDYHRGKCEKISVLFYSSLSTFSPMLTQVERNKSSVIRQSAI